MSLQVGSAGGHGEEAIGVPDIGSNIYRGQRLEEGFLVSLG